MTITFVRLCLILIVATVLPASPAEANNEYEIINTGIPDGGCWYDDTHFVIVKRQRQQSVPGEEFELEGLYFIDPAKPKDLRRIDLTPIETSAQKHIRDVSCREQTIIFHIISDDRRRNQIYTLKVGEAPALLAVKSEGFILPNAVSVKHRRVFSFTSNIGGNNAASPGFAHAETAKERCGFSYLQAGYQAICLPYDRGIKRFWLLGNSLLVEYLWTKTIRATKDGIYQWVPNPTPPLKLPDGSVMKQGYFLRDLETRIVRQVPTKQGLFKMDAISFKPNPAGTYLYARCSKAGDYDPPKTFFGRICRFGLDNMEHQWAEVFGIQKQLNEQASLYDLDVNDQGDVVVLRRAHRASPTLWEYAAQRASVAQLPSGQLSQEIRAVSLARNGHTISYIDGGQLVFVQLLEGRP